MHKNHFLAIERVIRKNLDKRGMEKIHLAGQLENASKALLESSRVLIFTGFAIKNALIGETDGPLGAISMAVALKKLGKKVVLVTDKYTSHILYNSLREQDMDISLEVLPDKISKEYSQWMLLKYKPSHMVAIERPGRAQDDCCYSMGGEDITHLVPNTDLIFEKAKEAGITTIGIGDGGNELGMGKIRDYVEKWVKHGPKICATFSSDYLIIAGVSNWGGYGVTAGLAILTNKILLHDQKTEQAILKAMVNMGAVDGKTKENTMTVDGFSLKENIAILVKLRAIQHRTITANTKIVDNL